MAVSDEGRTAAITHVAANKLCLKFAADRRLGCIAWFCIAILGHELKVKSMPERFGFSERNLSALTCNQCNRSGSMRCFGTSNIGFCGRKYLQHLFGFWYFWLAKDRNQ